MNGEYYSEIRFCHSKGVSQREVDYGKAAQSTAKCEEPDRKADDHSSYRCRLLSDLFTSYKVTRQGVVEQLKDANGHNTTFDCSKLSNYSFKRESQYLTKPGYGIDENAFEYLKETLNDIKSFNNMDDFPIVPLKVPGDGYCMLHAVSTCLVGNELFWHPLISNLNQNMIEKQEEYKEHLKSFFTCEDIDQFIRETHPNYQPSDEKLFGFTLVHIFALSHVLRRPIILFDAKMHANVTFTGLFLPILLDPEQCCDKENKKNPPLLLAWSSSARNHFVPLVGMADMQIFIPFHILPRAWGPNAEGKVFSYLDFDVESSIVFGSGKNIPDTYLEKLMYGMEKKFMEKYSISPRLVADFYYDVNPSNSVLPVKMKELISDVKISVDERCLLRCINCGLLKYIEILDSSMREALLPGGALQMLYKKSKLVSTILEEFIYDKDQDRLFKNPKAYNCSRCGMDVRAVKLDGDVIYYNGDPVRVATDISETGKMVYWNGKLYDNKPEKINIVFPFAEKKFVMQIDWFCKERDSNRNSNAYDIAEEIVGDSFENDAARRSLKSHIVEMIIKETSHLEGCEGITETNQNSDMQTNESPSVSSNAVMGIKSEREDKGNITYEKTKKTKKAAQRLNSKSSGGNIPCQPNSIGDQGTAKSEAAMGKEDETKNKTLCLKFNKKTVQVQVKSEMTYEDLQHQIQKNFDIRPREQIIKVGFPRRALEEPIQKGQPIALGNRETVFVDRCKEETTRSEEELICAEEAKENREEESKRESKHE